MDQYQNGLLIAEVGALREQARIYANALGESAARSAGAGAPALAPDLVRPLLRRLTEPTPDAQARVYAPDGQLVADSRVREGASGAVTTEPLPPAVQRGPILAAVADLYDGLLSLLPRRAEVPFVQVATDAAGIDWTPDVKQELRLTEADNSREMAPYIRRTADGRLLVSVSEPILRNRRTSASCCSRARRARWMTACSRSA